MKTTPPRIRLLAGVASVIVAVTADSALAEDLDTKLAETQSQIPTAEAAVSAAEPAISTAEDHLAPIRAAAEHANDAADKAVAKVDRTEQSLIDRRKQAANQVEALNAEQSAVAQSHDETVATRAGLGIAVAMLGLCTIAWPRLRTSRVAERLAEEPERQTVGIAAGALLLGFLIALALVGGSPVARIAGWSILGIGVGAGGTAVAMRHSVRIERGEGRPIALWQPAPPAARVAIAAALGVLVVVCSVGAATANQPAPKEVPPTVSEMAADAGGDPAEPPSPALIAAQRHARPLVARAARLSGARALAQEQVDRARDRLESAKKRLKDLESHVGELTSQIQKRNERAAEEAAQAAARQARLAAADQQQATSSSACTPGYSPCLAPASDYDCSGGSGDGPKYTGTVHITGNDPYDLDADGDGVGCQP